MKTLLLLSMLAFTLAAQNTKIEVPHPTPEDCERNRISCPEVQSQPTPDELNDIFLAVIKEQAARINWLQKLIAGQAGIGDSQQADQAFAERAKLVDNIAKKHGACEGAQVNFSTKQWVCPQK